MFNRIKQYQRYKDYYSLKSFEVKGSLLVTVILVSIAIFVIDLYDSFFGYQQDIKQLIITIISGEFTLLGMSLAGMAIVVSLLSPELMSIINKVDKNDTVNRILSQFEFFALNMGIQISYLFFILLIIMSDVKIAPIGIFLVVFTLASYHFFFNLFYIIALVGACIKLNGIKYKCHNILFNEKTLMDMANEIRIDYLLEVLYKDKNISKGEIMKELNLLVDRTNLKEKEDVKRYLNHYYKND